MVGPYFTGQVPIDPLVLTVNGSDGAAKDLSAYTSAEFILIDPLGEAVDVSGGSTNISDAVNGEVTFVWPATSLFDTAGDYRYQVRLLATDVIDYTGINVFEVYGRLGE